VSSSRPINYRKGDVVLVSFPYTTDDGQTQTKRRPAVIISNDINNARLDDVLLVPLTSNTTRAHKEPTQVEINMNSEEGKSGGLRLDSVIDCTVIATIPKTLLVSKIGQFPQETMERIDQCLMIAMAIGRPVRTTKEEELHQAAEEMQQRKDEEREVRREERESKKEERKNQEAKKD